MNYEIFLIKVCIWVALMIIGPIMIYLYEQRKKLDKKITYRLYILFLITNVLLFNIWILRLTNIVLWVFTICLIIFGVLSFKNFIIALEQIQKEKREKHKD